MLKIAEYNKNTGKKIDLKELEEFGFEVFNQSTARKIYYEHIPPVSMEDDTYFMIEHREIWFIENGAKESNERYFGNPQFDDLYDLIESGYVIKESE